MDEVNYKLVDFGGGTINILKHDTAFMLKPFRDLVRKDTGMIGDYDGKKKYKSARELAYIIYMNHPMRSPGLRAGYIGNALHEDAIKHLDLPEGWTMHTLLYECEALLVDYIGGVSKSVYGNILASMGNNNKLVTKLNEKISANLDLDVTTEGIAGMVKEMNVLINIAASYEKTVEALKEAEYRASQERKEITRSKGGKVVSASMDPHNAPKKRI